MSQIKIKSNVVKNHFGKINLVVELVKVHKL